jgi:hypothetical protein
MPEIARVLVNPVPVKVPLVAPVTVMLLAVKVVGSASNVSVKIVVVTEFEVPFAVRPEKVTGVAVAGNTAVTLPVLAPLVVIAPVTVKKFAATPAKVNPALAVSVIVAV